MKILNRCVALAFFAALTANASADILYSGGSLGAVSKYTGSYIWSYNMVYSSADNCRTYSNIAVPTGQTWSVTAFEAYVADPSTHYGSFDAPDYLWDIRTGMTTATLGTQVSSGTETNTTYSDLGITAFDWPVYLCRVNLASPVTLTGGQTYFLGLTPIHPDGYNAGILWSSGADTVGGPNDLNSIMWSFGGQGQWSGNNDPTDYAVELIGTTNVPEPASLAMLAITCAIPLFKRRK